MKKLLSLLFIIIITLSTVACSTSGGNSDEGETEISRGTIRGNIYTNKYLGYRFIKPKAWEFATDEEIAAIVNVSVDSILGENFGEALKESDSLYDMMVVDPVTNTNINVGYDNLANIFNYNVTVQQYLDSVKNQLATVSGMTVTFVGDTEKITLGETEFFKAVAQTKYNKKTMKQVFYLKKVDNYMCYIIATIPEGYTVAEIEAMFKEIP